MTNNQLALLGLFIITLIAFWLIGKSIRQSQIDKTQFEKYKRELEEIVEKRNQAQKDFDQAKKDQEIFLQKAFQDKLDFINQQADKKYNQFQEERLKIIEGKNEDFFNFCIELEAQQEDYLKNLEAEKKQEEIALQSKLEELNDSIIALKEKQNALIEAKKRESLEEEQKRFYKLVFSPEELEDIALLLEIDKKLHYGTAIKKLIWSEYYLKKFNELAARVLGTEKICGIYKITEDSSNKIYIGQSTDVKTRWSNHLKASLGIENIAHSKIHDAIKEKGVQSFTFELLEKVPKAQLNEREKYYINFYSSDTWGYNLTKGGS